MARTEPEEYQCFSNRGNEPVKKTDKAENQGYKEKNVIIMSKKQSKDQLPLKAREDGIL